MKKIFVLAFSVFVLASFSFAATPIVGLGGVAVSPSTALTGDNFHFNTFTGTYTAVTDVVNGIVYQKYPFKTWGTAVGKIAITAGVGAEVGPLITWNNLVDYFYGATITAAAGNTVNFAWSVTVPASAVVQAFTWYEANYSKTPVPSTQEIPAKTTITVTSSDNRFTLSTMYPALAGTPFILSTEKTNMVYKGKIDVASSGGQMIINLNPGNSKGIFAQTVPSPLTWVAQTIGSAMNNALIVVAQAGVFASPTCNGTECLIPILTCAANETFEIVYGPNATVTPGLGVQGTTYTDGLHISFKSNALFPAETVIPKAQPTTFVNTKGNYGQIVRVATPTIVLTVTANIDGSYTCYGTGYNNSEKTVSFGSEWRGAIDKNSTSGIVITPKDLLYGTYTVTLINRWKDVLNDGTYLTTTATTSVSIKPSAEQLQLAINNGIATKEYINTTGMGTYIHLTSYATAQYIYKVDAFGSTSTSTFARVVDGAASTVNVVMVPALALGTVGALDSPYTLAASTFNRWYLQQGVPSVHYWELYRLPLPTR